MPDRVWVKSLSWRALPADSTKLCRWGKGECDNRAEYELQRSHGRTERWWAYCRKHVEAYGNRVIGLEVQIDVPYDSPAAKRGWAQ